MEPDGCRAEQVLNSRYIVCRYDLSKVAFSVHWQGENGDALGSLGAAIRAVKATGKQPLFAMNGGMYDPDLSPVGYFVENGRKLRQANMRRGPGNFHMLPNGVFFVEGDKAGVMETGAFLKRNRRPDFATQSGPMLVINGQLHPKFRAKSESRKIRNGVGVSADGRKATFVLSDEPVTFHAFAKVFQRHLNTPNALFLDGSISQLASSTVNRNGFRPVGPVIIGTKR